jgi:hypothetical protein
MQLLNPKAWTVAILAAYVRGCGVRPDLAPRGNRIGHGTGQINLC